MRTAICNGKEGHICNKRPSNVEMMQRSSSRNLREYEKSIINNGSKRIVIVKKNVIQQHISAHPSEHRLYYELRKNSSFHFYELLYEQL